MSAAQSRKIKKWPMTIQKKYAKVRAELDAQYEEFKKSGLNPPQWDIKPANDEFSEFLIKLAPTSGIRQGQIYLVKFVARYEDKYFPFNPPKVTFISHMFHSNVSDSGSGYICLDILNVNWSEMYNFDTVVNTLFGFFEEPNPSSALNSDAAAYERAGAKKYKELIKSNAYDPFTAQQEAYADYIKKFKELDKINTRIYQQLWLGSS